ncbi:P-loop ATPase, Sll1717 family [Nioella sediminis]|uniref:P-loop ATPase, Sll1717 family n=1 Tax=Nioella sediminis TaxID=1912092 RepID=UPI0008FD7BCA|nr:ATP-binding protein [Nioella sediminis]TBX20986.1 hypothetical protein TK43_13780 [Roseovarius sp. JS7-11]
MSGAALQFDDETIRRLFGTDTAEDEDPTRLKEYFFRNKSYQNIRSSLPLRILVGHKGIGKSALLRMSHLEDQEKGTLSLWIQPNDLILENSTSKTFLEKISGYKILISRAIYNKALDSLGIEGDRELKITLQNAGKQIISALVQKTLTSSGAKVDQELDRLRKYFTQDREIRVYIDDIDRGWKATEDDINNISALVNAARDLTNEDQRLKIRIGLRSDAYYLYRTSDESTDKVESNVVRLSWTRHDVITVMALRVASYFGKSFDPSVLGKLSQSELAKEIHPVIEERYSVGKGHWAGAPIHIVLLSLNRNRPRDLIKLLTAAARQAYQRGHNKILSSDLESIFSDYSHGRITDLTLEFKSEMPQIEQLVYNMRPSSKRQIEKEKRWLYTNDELIQKIKNIKQSNNLFFSNGKPATDRAVAEFLYKIDFIIARNDDADGEKKWTHFDQNRMLQSQFVDFGYKWEVHPAYRWALQPKSVHEIMDQISSN